MMYKTTFSRCMSLPLGASDDGVYSARYEDGRVIDIVELPKASSPVLHQAGDATTGSEMTEALPPTPVGQLDERGEPVEEFWTEGDYM